MVERDVGLNELKICVPLFTSYDGLEVFSSSSFYYFTNHKQTSSSNKQLGRSYKRRWSNKVTETRSRNEKVWRMYKYEIKTIKNELINEFLTVYHCSSSSTTTPTIAKKKRTKATAKKKLKNSLFPIFPLTRVVVLSSVEACCYYCLIIFN